MKKIVTCSFNCELLSKPWKLLSNCDYFSLTVVIFYNFCLYKRENTNPNNISKATVKNEKNPSFLRIKINC